MKASGRLARAAAVGCSVLLVAGFVSYRAGAFDERHPPAPTAAPVDPATTAEPPPVLTPVEKDAVFSGSKSIILAPATATPPGGSTATPAPTILPGSKSAPVFDRPSSPPANPAK